MTAPKRRWFRFSLRTMFALVTIVALMAGYPAMKVSERRWMVRNLTARGALVVTWHKSSGYREPPIILSFFGAEPVQWIEFSKKGFTQFDFNHIAGTFPEADFPQRPITFWDVFRGHEEPR